MKHSRGIELFGDVQHRKPTREDFCLADVQQWYIIHGKCFNCGHTGYIDRWELVRKAGKRRPFLDMMPRLRCSRCGNRGTNSFCVSKMER